MPRTPQPALSAATPPVAAHGFTLVELMFVVAILGILVSLALPTYLSAQLRAGRAEAKSTLLEVSSNQERFYSINNSYSTDANPLTDPAQATLTSSSGLFVISVAACATGTIANCFLATATPQGSQADDDCGNFTLSSTGVRSTSAGDADDCWQR